MRAGHLALAPCLALLTACQEPPHQGVKLRPWTETARPAAPPVAAEEPPAAAQRQAGPALPVRAPAALPPAALPLPPPSAMAPPQQGRLDPEAMPRLVMPGEPTGNDDFRQALRQKFERQP